MFNPVPSESQIRPPLQENLSKAYGFCAGQQFSLERIKREFLALMANAIRAEKEFALVLGAACKNIENTLEKMLGNQWHEYRSTMNRQVQQHLSSMSMTQEQAAVFIQKVLRRAKGEIDSPILETLLSYHPSF